MTPYRIRAVIDAVREMVTLPRYRVSFRVLLGANTGADQTYTVRAWDAEDAHWRATVRALRSPVVLSAGPTRIVGGGTDTDYTRPCPCRASGTSAWCGLCDGAGSVPVCRPDNACPACHGCGITTEPGGTRVIPCACIVRAVAAHPHGQAWFWAEGWQTGEREAGAELAAGHGTVHTDANAMFAALDQGATVAREYTDADITRLITDQNNAAAWHDRNAASAARDAADTALPDHIRADAAHTAAQARRHATERRQAAQALRAGEHPDDCL